MNCQLLHHCWGSSVLEHKTNQALEQKMKLYLVASPAAKKNLNYKKNLKNLKCNVENFSIIT
jgi:hypothetical protein